VISLEIAFLSTTYILSWLFF